MREFVDKNGKKMHDAYLREQLDLRCPGLSDSYKLASEFVHFSKKALSLVVRVAEGSNITMGIGVEPDEEVNDLLIDLGNAALGAANLHISLVDSVVASRVR